MMKSRDKSIDFLRFLGISLIILAHVSPSNYILQIRTFDVPLMFFVSGLAYSGRNINYSLSFLSHRIKRLLVPVYIFITCYYIISFLYQIYTGYIHPCQIHDVINSFLLIGGIGYLWIIRVFLIIALLIPLIQKIEIIVKSNFILYLLTICWLSVWGIIEEKKIWIDNLLVREFVFYGAGYLVLFLWGLRIYKSDFQVIKRFILMTGFIFIICMAIIIYVNDWHKFAINAYKYPPRHYYLIYGILMSSLCFYLIKRRNLKSLPSIIDFIGNNTIWIYLYHIPIILITDKIHVSWIIRYIVLYSSAVFLCYIQVYYANSLINRNTNCKILKYLKG